MRIHRRFPWAAGLVLAALVGCEQAPEDGAYDDSAAGTGAEAPVPGPAAAGGDAGVQDAELVVYKSPTCGCCSAWIDHMQAAGFEVRPVDLVDYGDLVSRKRESGVPADLESCHTAVVDGYVIEGHVPAELVARLLRERPDIAGLAVPGMPIGSPGMEGPNPEPYDVIAFDQDGSREVFQRVDPR